MFHRPATGADLEVAAGERRLDVRARLWWRRCLATLADVLKDRQGHTEDVDVLGAEQVALDTVGANNALRVVTDTAQPSADHLFAQQLAGEGPKPEDMGDVLVVPAFRQHRDRDHVLEILPSTVSFS